MPVVLSWPAKKHTDLPLNLRVLFPCWEKHYASVVNNQYCNGKTLTTAAYPPYDKLSPTTAPAPVRLSSRPFPIPTLTSSFNQITPTSTLISLAATCIPVSNIWPILPTTITMILFTFSLSGPGCFRVSLCMPHHPFQGESIPYHDIDITNIQCCFCFFLSFPNTGMLLMTVSCLSLCTCSSIAQIKSNGISGDCPRSTFILPWLTCLASPAF